MTLKKKFFVKKFKKNILNTYFSLTIFNYDDAHKSNKHLVYTSHDLYNSFEHR